MDGGPWTQLPRLAPAGKGLSWLWPWHSFLMGKYYLHFSVPGKGHSGLGNWLEEAEMFVVLMVSLFSSF